MKRITLALMAVATLCTQGFAQQKVKNIYTTTQALNIEAVDNAAEQPVCIRRTLFAGYNTICLPMSLNASELKKVATDIQIERLAKISETDGTLNLIFLDCTNEGLEAGVPYLIYSPKLQTLTANSNIADKLSTQLQCVTKTDEQGNQVTFGSSWETLKVEGRYGIPAQQDEDILQSILIRTEADKAFLPTRCGFTWDSQSATASKMEIKHVTSLGDIENSIDKLQADDADVDIYDAKGNLVQKGNINKAMNTLPRGIYVINGQKVAVK